MRTTFLIILCCICASTLVRAQILLHPTPVSAGGVGSTAQFTVRGSLGQAFIGRPVTKNNIAGVGFWYRPHRGTGAVVAVPAAEGEIGSRVTIPLMLTHSKNLLKSGPRAFSAKLRYNRTVLVYKGPFAVSTIGDENIVTVTGTANDTVGILAQLEFLVTLGNAENTPIVIDTVEWVGSPVVNTDRFDGFFQALGVCKEGETVRLIRRKSTTAITGIAPQPAVDIIDVEVLLGADGPMSLHVIDLAGTNVAMLAYEENAKAGTFKRTFDVSMLISGSYYMVLQTPQQLHTASLIIRK